MIVLDYRDKRPIYEQVVEKLERLIICGALEANTKMPSVRSLAMKLSVNPNTIQRAYAQLEQDGYIYTVIGRGNYVTSEQEWKGSKMNEVMRELSTALTRAKEVGVTEADVRSLIQTVYATDISREDNR